MGLVKICWKHNIQDVYLPKISTFVGQIVSEILPQLYFDDSIKVFGSKRLHPSQI